MLTLFTVSKVEWDTNEETGKNSLWYAKRHFLGQNCEEIRPAGFTQPLFTAVSSAINS